MKNIEIKNKYELKLKNVSFKYIIDCLFYDNYSIDELYSELSRIQENISLYDLRFIKQNYIVSGNTNKVLTVDDLDIGKIRDMTDDDIFKSADDIIRRFSKLDMIYVRVSTKNEGQREEDQLPDIINTFNINLNGCLIVVAKESAFQEKKDKTRKFNIFYKLIEKYKEINKTLYVWDLDRIYRNQKKQAYFISYFADKNKCKVLSYRQKFFHQFKNMDGMGRAMYNFMIEVFGWMAEEESKKKGERLKKSLTAKNGRFITNKGNLYGRKLIKRIKSNKKKVYFSIEELDKIESIIMKLKKKGLSYATIQNLFMEKQNIKLSIGYIWNIVNKNINN